MNPNTVFGEEGSKDIICTNHTAITLVLYVTLYQVVPRHLILQRILLLILPKSEPGQLQTN